MKRVILAFLIAAAAIGSAIFVFPVYAEEGQIASSKIIAYYFHGSFRCPTCRKLEQYSKEAIEAGFKDELASGKLEYKAVNVEDKGNEHFMEDYQLYTKSLVLSSLKDGRETKWKNLDKIWEYVGDKERFIDYVKSGVSDFLRGAE